MLHNHLFKKCNLFKVNGFQYILPHLIFFDGACPLLKGLSRQAIPPVSCHSPGFAAPVSMPLFALAQMPYIAAMRSANGKFRGISCRFVFISCLYFACQPAPGNQQSGNRPKEEPDAPVAVISPSDTLTGNLDTTLPVAPKQYANVRFKEVTVTKTGTHQYTIRGKGQIFEGQFGWVVEDGHNELLSGFAMTDDGPPAWGNFMFTVEVQKQRPNSTLMLILYETSAKDGSRQYELPMVLE
jgi:hypothetical protein